MARVLVFGAAWTLCLAAVGVAVRQSSRPLVSVQHPVAVIKPPAPPPRAGTRYPGWTVTRAYSAHHMMVIEVETDSAGDGSKIARQLVEPLKDRYDEVLIYVRRHDQRPDDLPARRIQWTPRGGYVEAVYAPKP
jgi:hypothetical protein